MVVLGLVCGQIKFPKNLVSYKNSYLACYWIIIILVVFILFDMLSLCMLVKPNPTYVRQIVMSLEMCFRLDMTTIVVSKPR